MRQLSRRVYPKKVFKCTASDSVEVTYIPTIDPRARSLGTSIGETSVKSC
jgi:hypothetical protein